MYSKGNLTFLIIFFWAAVVAAGQGTVSTPRNTTIISRTVARQESTWKPFKVCVLDFTTLEEKSRSRYLNRDFKFIDVPTRSSDKVEGGFVQGIVRLIEAWNTIKINAHNRKLQAQEVDFNQRKALEAYSEKKRPVVIGAEYLTAFLGRHNEVFSCVDYNVLAATMQKLQTSPDFPRDFMLRLAKSTGATHLIYGTVSDIRIKTNSFKGYGIETKTTNYQLDVIIKMVDLISQSTAFSNVYTGNYREQRPISGTQFDHNIFQNLMTSALEQAAEDLYDRCRPGRKNKIKVSTMPCIVTVVPSGGRRFEPETAEVFVDGKYIGNGVCSFAVPPGSYTVEVKAAGYKNKVFPISVNDDQSITAKLTE